MTESPRVTALWGWSPAVRAVLAVVVVIAAIGLLANAPPTSGPAAPAPPSLKVDPNTAPLAVLEALPRIGPALAARIDAARRQAPFRSLGDFDRRVRGIGPATVNALRPFLRFDTDEPSARRERAGAAVHSHFTSCVRKNHV